MKQIVNKINKLYIELHLATPLPRIHIHYTDAQGQRNKSDYNNLIDKEEMEEGRLVFVTVLSVSFHVVVERL